MGCKFKALVVLWASWLTTRVSGQPAACAEDSQCPVGHYCEETALHCQKCLSCEDHKRQSPLQPEFCVKSVVQCGDCYEGLEEDLRMDRACVKLLSPEPGEALPAYVWAPILALVLVGLALLACIVFRKDKLFQYIFKIRATTSVHSTYGGASPSAPELAPPPYDELYLPPAAAAAPAAVAHTTTHVVEEDAARPFIKRVPSARARAPRESADSQAARPFNNPAYIRGPQDSSYIQSDESETASPPFTPHDEDTMESLWTPNENSNNIINNANGNALSDGAAGEAAGAAAADASDDEGPPAKTLCIREATNNNNNRGRETGGAGAGAGAGASAGAPTVVISVVNNFNSFEQRNNLNIPRH